MPRFNPLDKRCGINLDEIDPAQWKLLEDATDDYIEASKDRFQELADLLLSQAPEPGMLFYLKHLSRVWSWSCQCTCRVQTLENVCCLCVASCSIALMRLMGVYYIDSSCPPSSSSSKGQQTPGHQAPVESMCTMKRGSVSMFTRLCCKLETSQQNRCVCIQICIL